MKTKLLNGTWNLKILGKDAGLTGEAGLPAEVPGSVYATLLTEGKIEDPYYRDNELKTLPIMDNDFCYTTRFEVEPEWFSMDGLVECQSFYPPHFSSLICRCHFHCPVSHPAEKAG